MFWSLVLKPGRKYSSNLNVSIHVTNAVIYSKSFRKCSFCTGYMFRCSGNCVLPIRFEVDGKKLILCYLSEQCPDKNLDVTFDEGSTLIFRNYSSATIYLTGNTIVDETWRPGDTQSDADTSSEEYNDFLSEEEDQETTVENSLVNLAKVVDEESRNGEENREYRYYDEFDEKNLSDADDVQNKKQNNTLTTSADNKNKDDHEPGDKLNKSNITPISNEEDTNEVTPTQPDGCCVIIEELERGDGRVAVNGKEVRVRFVAHLAVNNDGFEMKSEDLGYKFTLGEGHCVKGFEMGLMGMKVGGRRRITCPSLLAYGTRGAPPCIPPDKDLIFDVELMSCT